MIDTNVVFAVYVVVFVLAVLVMALVAWGAYVEDQLRTTRELLNIAHRRLKELELHTGKNKPEDY